MFWFYVGLSVAAAAGCLTLACDPLLRAYLWPFRVFNEPEAEKVYRGRLKQAMDDRRRAPRIERRLARLGNSVADEVERRKLLDEKQRLEDRDNDGFCPLHRFLTEAEGRNRGLAAEKERKAAEMRKAQDDASSAALLERLWAEAAFMFGSVAVVHHYSKIYDIDEWCLVERRFVTLDGVIHLITFNRTLEVRPESERRMQVVDDAQLRAAYRELGQPPLGRADFGFKTTSFSQFNPHELQELAARGY